MTCPLTVRQTVRRSAVRVHRFTIRVSARLPNVLRGSMRGVIVVDPFSLGSGDQYQTLETALAFTMGPCGRMSIQVAVDGGSDGVAPTDAPVGAFRLFASVGDMGAPWVRIVAAEGGDNSLADLSPRGNVAVDGIANFEGLPLGYGRLIYTYGSGGGGDSRARLWIRVE